jgi:hypothetical protein
MKNFIKLSVVPGNLTMDQYRGFRTITLCPATQTNPPCSSLRATVTKLPSKGTVFQPLMTAGTLSDKRGPPILSVNSIILPSISAAANVIILQYQAREVGVKPVAGAIWDSIECEPNMRFMHTRVHVCVCSFDILCMYNLEEMLMPDEIPFGNFNSILPQSHIFLNPQNHYPIIGLAGSMRPQKVSLLSIC